MDDKIEKIVEAPAIALDKTVAVSTSFAESFENGKTIKFCATYWNTLGPGLTTGAADDDPSGIATYSQQGAQTGLQLLWLAAFSFPLMAIVQEMCARIGIVTDRGLAANIRRNYPRWVLLTCAFLLLGANILNLGADIGAMAKGVQLIMPNLNFVFLIITFTLLITGLQIYTTYKVYAKYLKWLALVLFAYVFSAFSINGINWHQVAINAILPSFTFSKASIFLITAILGTTISPYLFFWQTSQEVEEKLARRKGIQAHIDASKTELTAKEEIHKMRIDTWSGMFVSNLVMFFIIVATAFTLFTHGITNINTASDAALALRPIAGQYAYLLFAIGIIGAGLLAVPVLAGSASYALSESFGWKTSLSHKLKDAYAFYGIIIIAMVIGLAINFIGLDPIKALIYSAVLNGLIAPIILFLIVQMSSSKKIMGKHKNNRIVTALGWITTGVMACTAVATIVSSFFS
ncbi:MAG TPA: divalent metal cation transporter [Patescibacteria group bacterium]|nr:divalent metal cation transporter [Patescibacteria group bacterium]